MLNAQLCLHSDIYLSADFPAPGMCIGFELTSVSVLESSGQIPCCVQILAGTPQEDVTVLIVDQSGTAASKLYSPIASLSSLCARLLLCD